MDKNSEDVLSHYQIAAAQKKHRDAKDDKYKELSKTRLSNIITTKMKTSFIGSISACEDSFGFLWGHEKEENDLTANEVAMREIWEGLRAEILDNGNSQLRASMNEISNYNIQWCRYHLDFPTKEQGE